jgi:hypothetical protein
MICKNSVRTTQDTGYVSSTKTNQLILFREKVTVYCENHTKPTNALCGQNAEFYYVKADGIYGNHWALKG